MKRLVHPVRYHIPTFDEVVAEGTANASKAIGEELIELLKSDSLNNVSTQDLDDISKLISHDGFDKETAQTLRNLLTAIWYQRRM